MSQTVVVTAPGGTAIVNAGGGSVVSSVPSTVVVEREAEPRAIVVTRGIPGPRGPQGIPGPAGGATTVTVGATPLSGHSAVAVNAAGLLVPADSTNPAHRGAVLGLVANAYSPGDEAVVQTGFVLEHAGWTWAPGPVFVGIAGQFVQSLPAGALFSQVVGEAISATRLLIDLHPPISIA